MRSLLQTFPPIVCLLAVGACVTGKVTPDLNDVTPPEITSSVTALDPEDQTAKSTAAPPGSSLNLAATENTDIIIVASANDAGGIKSLRIWNVGANLKDMTKGEVLRGNSQSQSAFFDPTAEVRWEKA